MTMFQNKNVKLGLIFTLLTAVFALPFVVAASPASSVSEKSADALPRLVLVNATVITQTTNFTAYEWSRGSTPFEQAEVFYKIDQTLGNTTTIKIQVSPDNSNWVDYVAKGAPGISDGAATVVAANTADASGYVSAQVHMRYMRIVATVTTADPLTPTIKLWLR
jgi:hypothetical protein